MNKSIRSFKQSAQAGFTLIELVVVIVILGILAATAIPKFADMSADARAAKISGARSALQAASSLAHAQWLVAGGLTTTTSVTMEGTAVTLVNGYPAATAAGIGAAAGGLADYTRTPATGTPPTYVVTPDASHTTCSVTYTESSGANVASSVSAAPLASACN